MTSARSAAKEPKAPARPTPKPSREEKKAITRAKLLDAAAAVFARKGLADASLDDIAEEAGLTKGAVYSNFASKEELIRALLDFRLGEPSRAIPRLIDMSGTQEEQAAQAGRLFMGLLGNERDAYLLELEFLLYLARHPEANDPGRYFQNRAMISDEIATRAAEYGLVLPLSPDELAATLFALGMGIALERMVNPESIPADLFTKVLGVFFFRTG